MGMDPVACTIPPEKNVYAPPQVKQSEQALDPFRVPCGMTLVSVCAGIVFAGTAVFSDCDWIVLDGCVTRS